MTGKEKNGNIWLLASTIKHLYFEDGSLHKHKSPCSRDDAFLGLDSLEWLKLEDNSLTQLGGEVVFVISRCQLILLPASCLAAVIAHCAALTIQGPGVGQQGPVRYCEAQ